MAIPAMLRLGWVTVKFEKNAGCRREDIRTSF